MATALFTSVGASAEPISSKTHAAAPDLTRGIATRTARAGMELYLRAFVNGGHGQLAHFRLNHGRLYASHDALKMLGFKLPLDTADPVALQSLHGVVVNLDFQQQTVKITAPLSLLNVSMTRRSNRSGKRPQATASPGLLFNYALHGSHIQHAGSSLSAFTQQRVFGFHGILNDDLLTRFNTFDHGSHTRTVRLNTYWQSFFPNRMVSVILGDDVPRVLPSMRATRLSGLTISRDFSLQPYRTTIPLQSFLGKAVVPSRVELYVDGVRQFSGQVPIGPYNLNINPGLTGIGHARLFVTNALGQVSTQSFNFYGTTRLLQKSLSDWSATLGVVRQNFGITSFDYGRDPVFSGFARYGFTDWLTGSTHLAATPGLANAGFGGAWLLGSRGGVMNVSVAASQSSSKTGERATVGYNWHNRLFGFGFEGRAATAKYRDVGALNGAPVPRSSTNVHVSFSPQSLGTFSFNYFGLRFPSFPASRFITASWFKSFRGRFSLGLSFSRQLNNNRDYAAFLSVSFFPGRNTTVYGSATRQSHGTQYILGASHPVPVTNGFGWRVQASHNAPDNFASSTSGTAQLGYQSRYGRISGGVQLLNGDQHNLFANARGSLVFMNGALFAARHIFQSFAVVSTNGVPDVPVTLRNNVIGTTNGSGNLLVTRLLPWQNNKIGIDTLQLPANMSIATVEKMAVPRRGSGTLVQFPIRRVRTAVITLVTADGKPIPLRSVAHVNGRTGKGKLAGYGGLFYVDHLKKSNVLDVRLPDAKHCHVHFGWAPAHNGIPRIGPLICRAGKAK